MRELFPRFKPRELSFQVVRIDSKELERSRGGPIASFVDEKYRAHVRAAQVLTQAELLINDVAFQIFPVLKHRGNYLIWPLPNAALFGILNQIGSEQSTEKTLAYPPGTRTVTKVVRLGCAWKGPISRRNVAGFS